MADKPVTREEKYLAYLTGDYKGELPKPITRKEKYLYELCLKGMGGEISLEQIKAAVNEYLEKNPVKPGATTEQAQQIEQNNMDIVSLKAETSSIKEDISTKITKFYASSQGETHLADSDNGKIMDMMLYGKSLQDGTPTPENPVEIKSVVNPTIKITNEDGLNVQSVTLNNITLNAIPVSSGGNVTIDGHQYIADYVDVERGKLVMMVDTVHPKTADDMSVYAGIKENVTNYRIHVESADKKGILSNMLLLNRNIWANDVCGTNIIEYDCVDFSLSYEKLGINSSANAKQREIAVKTWLENNDLMFMYIRRISNEIDLTPEEVQAFKALATYYPVTNISVNSEQLDGYTVFNYPISLANGWNYVKQQLNDNRDYIYDMDLQSAEAYVNSEYAVALTELEV